MTNDYVRLVRDQSGTIIDSFDANGEVEALRREIETQKQTIADLNELLKNVRRMALEMDREHNGSGATAWRKRQIAAQQAEGEL